MPKSIEAIVAILATLKADCVFVPLDTRSPVARSLKIIRASDGRCLLAAPSVEKGLRELIEASGDVASLPLGWISMDGGGVAPESAAFTWEEVASLEAGVLDSANGADDPAYILFTSGSTGDPKGVLITHGNVLRFVEWAIGYFGIDETDRVSAHPPLYFDLSVFDIFGTFAAGAELHLVPAEVNLLAHKLAEFIRSSELTQWFSVPSVLNYLMKFDVLAEGDFPTLRRVIWCGEVLPTPTLMYWMQCVPHASFTNLYGPTEATIASSYYTVARCPTDKRAPLPIGSPCDGERLYVLNADLEPVPAGEVGDLYIAGVGLSPGYWRDPAKTASAFVPSPFAEAPGRIYRTGDLAKVGPDGLFYFLGRADTQIKSRGYRIELGEIEAALQTLAGLREVGVVAIPSEGFAGWTICCGYAVETETPVEPPQLRSQLSNLLPSYMIPSRWEFFDWLPKTSNGKIDKRSLKEHFQSRATRVSSSSAG